MSKQMSKPAPKPISKSLYIALPHIMGNYLWRRIDEECYLLTQKAKRTPKDVIALTTWAIPQIMHCLTVADVSNVWRNSNTSLAKVQLDLEVFIQDYLLHLGFTFN